MTTEKCFLLVHEDPRRREVLRKAENRAWMRGRDIGTERLSHPAGHLPSFAPEAHDEQGL